MNPSGRPILVVGSINMDLVFRVPRLPAAGETAFGTAFAMHPGGKGANQAVGVARLGYPVAMLGAVGRDDFGIRLRAQLAAEGVDTRAVLEVETATGTAAILVEGTGENCIIVTPGANSRITPEVVRGARELVANAGAVLAQLEIPLESVTTLAELCAELDVPLILDPAPARELPAGTLAQTAWLTPNETEAQLLAAGAEGEEGIVAELSRQGARGVILKRGARGAIIAENGKAPVAVSATQVDAVDTTAAGDGFNAAFAVALLRGRSPVESARFAAAAAAISVTRPGAQTSLARQDELSEELR